MKIAMSSYRLVGCPLGMLLLISVGCAHAVCSQADLTGTWYAIGIGGNVGSGSLDEIDRCKIRVSSTGAIIASGSSCSYRVWNGTGTSNITGGSVRISSSCAVTGNARFCNSYGCATMLIQYAQMERNKTAFAMAGYIWGSPQEVGFMEFVKQ